jgi:hypothetical protein
MFALLNDQSALEQVFTTILRIKQLQNSYKVEGVTLVLKNVLTAIYLRLDGRTYVYTEDSCLLVFMRRPPSLWRKIRS